MKTQSSPDTTFLPAVQNKYGGMVINADSLPQSIDAFSAQLEHSLALWREQGIKLVWLQLAGEQAVLLPAALAAGFEFHHCAPTSVMLVRVLESGAIVPHYARHTIGAGAVVLSAQQQLLAVLEKGDAMSRPWHYKLPGGMLEPGEHIAAAAVREVFEETGVTTRFEGLLGLRHHHQGQFGTSNFYMVCRLTPLTTTITLDTTEIADAKWIPAQEYLRTEGVGLLNKRVVAAALVTAGMPAIELNGYMGGPGEYEVFVPDFVDPAANTDIA